MEALLVVTACYFHNAGCQKASEAYYMLHPGIKQLVDEGGRYADKNVPPILLQYVLPAAAFAYKPKNADRLPLNIKLTRNSSLRYNGNQLTLNIFKEF